MTVKAAALPSPPASISPKPPPSLWDETAAWAQHNRHVLPRSQPACPVKLLASRAQLPLLHTPDETQALGEAIPCSSQWSRREDMPLFESTPKPFSLWTAWGVQRVTLL